MSDLIMKNINKVYPNGVKAVSDFNMSVKDGEFVVFVGPSGCGKSTTLRMIAGLEEITSGELIIGGVLSNDIEPKDRDIAMVFQNYALYPHMTVAENIDFNLRLHKVDKEEIKRRVDEVADILDIKAYLKRKPQQLSGGQRQRVALGRAIIRNPKLMLFDEPLSNLDAQLRTEMRANIAKLHQKLKVTFIYVTHDQVEAMTMGTRIVVMKDGFVQQLDTPKNLYNYPINKFVAGFIGTPKMNFLEGTLKKDGEMVEIRFMGNDAVIKVPYSYFYKTDPKYLDGKTPIVIGLRAEDISLNLDAYKDIEANLKIKVSHTELLGNETLVYGDINLESDGFKDSGTNVIIKGKDEEFSEGEIITVALNLNRIHLFDKDTEKTILPRIPECNIVDCEVEGESVRFLGQTMKLPPAIKGQAGANELHIPTDAIMFGGDIPAKIVDREQIGETSLLAIEVGERRLFAVAEVPLEGDAVRISIDTKRISLWKDGTELVSSLPLANSFTGTFERVQGIAEVEKKGKVKRKKIKKFVLSFGGAQFDCPEAVTQKLIDAFTTKKALRSSYTFECSPYDIAFGESAMKAIVLEILDYGTERFAKCAAGEQIVYVKTDTMLSGDVELRPNLSKLSIVEKDMNIRVL